MRDIGSDVGGSATGPDASRIPTSKSDSQRVPPSLDVVAEIGPASRPLSHCSPPRMHAAKRGQAEACPRDSEVSDFAIRGCGRTGPIRRLADRG